MYIQLNLDTEKVKKIDRAYNRYCNQKQPNDCDLLNKDQFIIKMIMDGIDEFVGYTDHF